ncbi:MAG: DUF6029 family protein [Bacteroidota bacterium]
MIKRYSTKIFLVVITLLQNSQFTIAQQVVPGINGNFEINSQYYEADSAIEAPEVKEKLLNNGFLNLNYINGNFRAGLRYEAYLNPLLGFDSRFQGSGIPFRYASYNYEGIDVTVGNFYDQFGNGLIFRSYEERAIGTDNAMDGIRVAYQPIKGVTLKGLVGRQRDFFELGEGLVRGADADVQLSDAIPKLKDSKLRVGLGGSFVSKFQADDDIVRILPENVASFAARTNINVGKFAFNAEYAYKYNDPYIGNGFIYKNGEALYLNASYTKKGIGAAITAKRIDNMGYRSERSATVNQLIINYLPAINKQHTYRLVTLYPYATQPNGEMGISGELYYNFKSGTSLGGKYGTTIAINASSVNDIKRTPASNDTLGYESDFFAIGETKYYQDASLEVTKKISKKVKVIASYIYQLYNKDIVEGKNGFGLITAHTGVIELTWKITDKHSIRTEFQHLLANKDKGDWALALVEYSVSPYWSVAVYDEYNYGNEDTDHRYHYYNASFAYTKNANRFSLGYVRQRAGLLCVGGVCRVVPASNGVSLSITSRF